MDKNLQVVTVHLLTNIGLIFFIFPSNIIASVEVGHWFPILIGFTVHLIILAIYLKGLSYFPKNDLMDIYTKTGKAVAVILLFPVLIYLLMVITVTVRAYSEAITLIFLSNTPLWAVIFLTLAIPTYIAFLGIEALFRTGVLMGCLFMPLIAFVLCVSFQNADWHYIFPLLEQKFSFLTHRNYLESSFAFIGGFMYLGFIQPYVTHKHKKLFWSSFLLLPMFIISVYVPVLTFGQATASQFQFPFIMAIDTLDVNWLMFDRVTVFFLLSIITFVMLFISLVLWSSVQIMRRSLPAANPIYFVGGTSVVIYFICLRIPNWADVELLYWWNTLLRFYVYVTISVGTFFIARHAYKKAGAAQ